MGYLCTEAHGDFQEGTKPRTVVTRFLSPSRRKSRVRQKQESTGSVLKHDYALVKEVWVNLDLELHPGSPNQGVLSLLCRWQDLVIDDCFPSPSVGPFVSSFLFLIWLLWHCHGVRCMMGISETATQMTFWCHYNQLKVGSWSRFWALLDEIVSCFYLATGARYL